MQGGFSMNCFNSSAKPARPSGVAASTDIDSAPPEATKRRTARMAAKTSNHPAPPGCLLQERPLGFRCSTAESLFIIISSQTCSSQTHHHTTFYSAPVLKRPETQKHSDGRVRHY